MESDVQDAYRARGLDEARVRWVLRFYEVTYIDWNGFNHHSTFDVGIDRWGRSWYVLLWSPEKSYLADLGFVTQDGTFVSMARSNTISTPRSSPSPFERPEWGTPDGPGGVHRLAEEPDYRAVGEAIIAARKPLPPAPPLRSASPVSLPRLLKGILRPFLPPEPSDELDRIAAEMGNAPGPFAFFYAVEALFARAGVHLSVFARRRLMERLSEWADRRYRTFSTWAGPLPSPVERPVLGPPSSFPGGPPVPPDRRFHPPPPSGHSPGAPGAMFFSGRGR